MLSGDAANARWISPSGEALTFFVGVIGLSVEAVLRFVLQRYPTMRTAIQESGDGYAIVIAPGLYGGKSHALAKPRRG